RFQDGRRALWLPGRKAAAKPRARARTGYRAAPGRMRAVARACRDAARARRYLRTPAHSTTQSSLQGRFEEVDLCDRLECTLDVEQRVQEKREQRRAAAPSHPAEKQT